MNSELNEFLENYDFSNYQFKADKSQNILETDNIFSPLSFNKDFLSHKILRNEEENKEKVGEEYNFNKLRLISNPIQEYDSLTWLGLSENDNFNDFNSSDKDFDLRSKLDLVSEKEKIKGNINTYKQSSTRSSTPENTNSSYPLLENENFYELNYCRKDFDNMSRLDLYSEKESKEEVYYVKPCKISSSTSPSDNESGHRDSLSNTINRERTNYTTLSITDSSNSSSFKKKLNTNEKSFMNIFNPINSTYIKAMIDKINRSISYNDKILMCPCYIFSRKLRNKKNRKEILSNSLKSIFINPDYFDKNSIGIINIKNNEEIINKLLEEDNRSKPKRNEDLNLSKCESLDSWNDFNISINDFFSKPLYMILELIFSHDKVKSRLLNEIFRKGNIIAKEDFIVFEESLKLVAKYYNNNDIQNNSNNSF